MHAYKCRDTCIYNIFLCMNIYLYTNIHSYTYTYICVYINEPLNLYLIEVLSLSQRHDILYAILDCPETIHHGNHLCMYICMFVYIYIYTYTYIYSYIYMIFYMQFWIALRHLVTIITYSCIIHKQIQKTYHTFINNVHIYIMYVYTYVQISRYHVQIYVHLR
jgi:hypothetical protein